MTSIEMKNKLLKQRVDITFQNLSYHVAVPKQKEKKAVLKGISGTFKSGQLTAIMGPSGAGKSSLMNILTGFTKTGVTGNIQFGELPKSRKMCAYIMQDDHFYSWLTVEEVMIMAASLKISNKSMSLKEKRLLIESILNNLKLSVCKETKCGRLSGGQKKRLSIALELIDNPAVLFLDEPTTGLDSSSSYDTIKLLQILALEGRTIVCTIHQPSTNIYNLFDLIYVMSGGQCTYKGTPWNTVQYLQKEIGLECPAYHNPADFLLECVNGDYGDFNDTLAKSSKDPRWCLNNNNEAEDSVHTVQWNKMIEATAHKNRSPSITPPMQSTKHVYPPQEFLRLWILIGRCHVQFFRDWTATYLKLLVHIVCGIVIGLLFGDSGNNATKQFSNTGSFLVHLVYLWYTNMMPGVLRFPQEINIIKKETFNNWYKLKTYYLAAMITSTPVHIMFSATYISIIYFLTDQPFELERYVKFLLVAVALTISADGFGILVGTCLNPINGTFIGAICSCFMLIFSGYLILLKHMSNVMQAVSYLSPIRYAFENMMLSVYSDNRGDLICPEDEMYCHFKSPNLIINTFGMENGSYGLNIMMQVLQVSIFKCLGYYSLRFKIQQ